MIYIGEKPVRWVYKGTTPVDMYARNELVWRELEDVQFSLLMYQVPEDRLSEWITLATTQLDGYGPVTMNMDFSWQGSPLQWVQQQRRVRFVLDGQQVGTYLYQNFTTGTWNSSHTIPNVEIPINSTLEVQVWIDGGAGYCRMVTMNNVEIRRDF